MGITKAQAKLLATTYLDNLGSAGGGGNLELSVVEQLLSEGAKAFIEDAKENLNDAKAIATGELLMTFTFTLEQSGNKYTLTVGYPKNSKAAQYFDFVNKGVAGTESGSGEYKFKTPYPSRKMALAILNWYRLSGKQARNVKAPQNNLETKRTKLRDAVKQSDSLKSLAYATATSIKKKGLKATHYFDKARDSTFNDEFKGALQIALGADVKIQILKLYDNRNI